jgi:hypothetical protein
MAMMLLILPFWLKAGFRWPLFSRVAWLSIPVFSLGLTLGRLFPPGLRLLKENEIPWAWALNGWASVLGSIAAVLLGMQFGFTAVLWQALGLYCAAGVFAANWDLRLTDGSVD